MRAYDQNGQYYTIVESRVHLTISIVGNKGYIIFAWDYGSS